MSESALLSVEQTIARLRAHGLRVGPSTLRAKIALNQFPGLRLGRAIAVPAAQLDRWLRGEWRPNDSGGDPEPAADRARRRPLRLVRRQAS